MAFGCQESVQTFVPVPEFRNATDRCCSHFCPRFQASSLLNVRGPFSLAAGCRPSCPNSGPHFYLGCCESFHTLFRFCSWGAVVPSEAFRVKPGGPSLVLFEGRIRRLSPVCKLSCMLCQVCSVSCQYGANGVQKRPMVNKCSAVEPFGEPVCILKQNFLSYGFRASFRPSCPAKGENLETVGSNGSRMPRAVSLKAAHSNNYSASPQRFDKSVLCSLLQELRCITPHRWYDERTSFASEDGNQIGKIA